MLEYAVHACTYGEPPTVSLDRSPMHACGSLLLLLLLSHALLGLSVDEVHGHVHEHDGAQQQHHRGAGLAAERVRVEHLYRGGHHYHGHTTGRSKGATRYHMSACHVSTACSTAPAAGGRTDLGALDLEPVLHHATGAQLQQRREDEGDDEALTGTPTRARGSAIQRARAAECVLEALLMCLYAPVSVTDRGAAPVGDGAEVAGHQGPQHRGHGGQQAEAHSLACSSHGGRHRQRGWGAEHRQGTAPLLAGWPTD